MTGPTREELDAWEREAAAYADDPASGREHAYWGNAYAAKLTELALAFAAGSRASSTDGAQLVREIEEAAARITNMPVDSLNNDVRDWIAEEMCSEPFWWPRIRSALIAGDNVSADMTGAELVLAMENTKNDAERAALWPRLRTALLSGFRSEEDARDAARYRWLRDRTRGERKDSGATQFTVPMPKPVGDIMRGSVAQHLDAAIDAAMGGNDA